MFVAAHGPLRRPAPAPAPCHPLTEQALSGRQHLQHSPALAPLMALPLPPDATEPACAAALARHAAPLAPPGRPRRGAIAALWALAEAEAWATDAG